MAQPLQRDSPAFCLSIYGINNKFTYEDVQKRWNTIKELAKQEGIRILGFSSDGDWRLLKVMRLESQVLQASCPEYLNWHWFHCTFNSETIYIQDTVHILTKLKTRFTKPSVFLPFGNDVISSSHLLKLITDYSKDKHLLVENDLNSDDKMNFNAVLKISSECVLSLLADNIPESKGTVLYLTLLRNINESFLNKDISLRKRIYLMWYTVFILRIWRGWLDKEKQNTV